MVFSGRPWRQLAVRASRVNTQRDRRVIRVTSVAGVGGLTRTRRAVTCVRTKWGVSDPRRSGAGTASGGWQRGSLTPHITAISHPRGFTAAKIAALIIGTAVSRTVSSSMTCHGTLSVELFEVC